MKKVLIAIISICFPLILNAQHTYNIQINWKNTSGRPYFTNCHYFDSLPSTPFYFIEVPLNQINSRVDVEIKNTSTKISTVHEKYITSNTPSGFKIKKRIVKTKKKPSVQIWVNAAIKQNNKYALLNSAKLQINIREKKGEKFQTKSYPTSSVLNSGDWRKVSITQSGIYKISYNKLSDWGFNSPASIRIYGMGGQQLSFRVSSDDPETLEQIPVYLEKGSDGVFNSGDYILFYGHGIMNRHVDINSKTIDVLQHDYSNKGHYLLTTSMGPGKRVENVNYNGSSASATITKFTDIQKHYFEETNINKTGRVFFSQAMSPGDSTVLDFNFPNIITTEPILLTSDVAAVNSGSNSFMSFRLNGAQIHQSDIPASSTYWDGRIKHIQRSIYAPSQEFNFSLQYLANNVGARGYIGFVAIMAKRSLSFTSEQMVFQETDHLGAGTTLKYSIQNSNADLRVWEISSQWETKQVSKSNSSNSVFEFKYPENNNNLFIAFDGSNYLSVNDEGRVENQDLLSLGFFDLFIVTHPDFRAEAEELAQFHRDFDNMKVLVIEPQKIYTEFSGGNKDASAIRNFIKMFYDRANNSNEMPKHLLLFGDGFYDNKASNANNYIITYQTANLGGDSTRPNSVACDDFFVMLDEGEGGDDKNNVLNGTLDMGIGRFPVNNSRDAQILVEKTIDYVQNPNLGPWKNELCFLADDANGGDDYLQRHAYELVNTIIRDKYPWFNNKLLLMDAYQQVSTPSGDKYPSVTQAINENIHRGVLIFNYTGHGGEVRMAHENVLNKGIVEKWTNEKLPFVMTGSCEITRFDYDEETLGETMLLREDAGAITLFSTTRIVYGGSNQTLSRHFYNNIFEVNEEGNFKTLGEIIAVSKNLTADSNMRKFALFGDPAVQLDMPTLKAFTDSINGLNASTVIDTLKALKKIKIQGYITDTTGKARTNFNGRIYPVVFDKLKTRQTLNNDNNDSGPFTYQKRENIIYKGSATVENGEFWFEFIVPIDIDYVIGQGKISYYAEDGERDANGFFDNFMVGGSSEAEVDDNQGPEIELYLEDTTFVTGGTTNESPLLIAHLKDEYGINITGNSIGHDITAILNEEYTDKIILNDFYENNLNSYQSGKIEYQLLDLDDGLNKLKVKAYDIVNNSSEVYTEFIVANSEEVVLKHVLNYPNPFTTKTKFLFEHNQTDQMIDVRIQVFTVSGKLVKTLESTLPGTQYLDNPIVWDGRDDFGDPIGKGVYVYKVSLYTEDGKNGEKFEKLVILR